MQTGGGEEKMRIVEEIYLPRYSVSLIARRHGSAGNQHVAARAVRVAVAGSMLRMRKLRHALHITVASAIPSNHKVLDVFVAITP